MAAPYNPPVKGEDFVFYLTFKSLASPGTFVANPTIAAGDFKISKDGGALADLATLPVVTPASSIWVKVSLSVAEMTADVVNIQAIDLTIPKAWADVAICIPTTA